MKASIKNLHCFRSYILDLALANFFHKMLNGNIFAFTGHTTPVMTTHLCNCSTTHKMHGCVSIKLFFGKIGHWSDLFPALD